MKSNFPGILVEKWRRKSGGGTLAVANEAERLVFGSAGWRSYVEMMNFEGKVLRKIKTKGMRQIEITSDASKVYLLSGGGKIFACNSKGEKLKKFKCNEWIVSAARHLSISEDGSMVTAGDALMDAEGTMIRFSDGMHTVIDAYSGKPEQRWFFQNIVGIAPNGTYVVVHGCSPPQKREFFKGTSHVTQTATYQSNDIYIQPQSTSSLSNSREKQGSQQWKSVPFNLNRDMGPSSQFWFGAKVCLHNSFFACARESIGYVGLDGNLKWEFRLRYRNEIKEFYVTPNAKYVFFTLRRRKNRKSIFILDAENREVYTKQLDIKGGVATFKATNDGRKLFIHTFSNWSRPPPGRVIAFDVRIEDIMRA